MFDLFVRALTHPRDYLTMFHSRTLVLQEIIHEAGDIYSFVFKPTKPFVWQAGQHGVFHFPTTKITGKTWRAFSIASSAQEGMVRIATIIKEDPSDFKKHLLAMKIGDQFIMNGPLGEFHTSPSIAHIVGIAGGIGITPFRALIKDISLGVILQTKLTLIYSAIGAPAFKDELEILAQHRDIEIIYTQTPNEVNQALEHQIATQGNSAYYFVSGSPGMIGVIRKTLKSKGIRHIINDPFKGY